MDKASPTRATLRNLTLLIWDSGHWISRWNHTRFFGKDVESGYLQQNLYGIVSIIEGEEKEAGQDFRVKHAEWRKWLSAPHNHCKGAFEDEISFVFRPAVSGDSRTSSKCQEQVKWSFRCG